MITRPAVPLEVSMNHIKSFRSNEYQVSRFKGASTGQVKNANVASSTGLRIGCFDDDIQQDQTSKHPSSRCSKREQVENHGVFNGGAKGRSIGNRTGGLPRTAARKKKSEFMLRLDLQAARFTFFPREEFKKKKKNSLCARDETKKNLKLFPTLHCPSKVWGS
ncbi:hypothetical protein SRHO_G00237930 [Serrasalmus rhombeus]